MKRLTCLGRWLALVLVLAQGVGCSSSRPKESGEATAADVGASQPRKGRWVLLPPATGSNVSRRVWVSEDGKVQGSMDDAQTTSSRFLEDTQRRGVGTFQNRD